MNFLMPNIVPNASPNTSLVMVPDLKLSEKNKVMLKICLKFFFLNFRQLIRSGDNAKLLLRFASTCDCF